MTNDNKYKKKLGAWGEVTLDHWMTQQSWIANEKNRKIKGGEIDRIYFYKNNFNIKKVCVAEIKTTVISSQYQFQKILTETGLKQFYKCKQIQNLYKIGEIYLRKNYQFVYIRLFIILKFNNIKKLNIPFDSIKVCFKNNEFAILSVEPEYTLQASYKSSLQIKI